MVDHGDDNVVRFTLAFVILAIILFTGIFSMMQPDKFGVASTAKKQEYFFRDILFYTSTNDGRRGARKDPA